MEDSGRKNSIKKNPFPSASERTSVSTEIKQRNPGGGGGGRTLFGSCVQQKHPFAAVRILSKKKIHCHLKKCFTGDPAHQPRETHCTGHRTHIYTYNLIHTLVPNVPGCIDFRVPALSRDLSNVGYATETHQTKKKKETINMTDVDAHRRIE